jgi:hypothetical protein
MSKLKKLVKKIGKAALLGGGAYLAAKGLSGKGKGKPSTNAAAIKAMTSNDAYSDDTMPGMLSKDMGIKRRRRDSILGKPGINRFDDGNMYQPAKNGGRIGKKSGGSVKKSMGKALRGGGKVMR